RALFVHTAHETAGAARIRHSLRPLNRGGRKSSRQNSGAKRREIVATYSGAIARLPGRSSIPETLVKELRSRGVLVPRRSLSSGGHSADPVAEDDSGVWSGTIHRHLRAQRLVRRS